MKEYQIDAVDRSEYEAVLAVWEASVRATHHFITEADIQYFKPLILKQYFDAVELNCVRNDEGQILGFSGVADGNLEMLFIDPVKIGQGIGRALLKFTIDQKGVSKVDVNEQNAQALGFYEKFGFKVIGRSEKDPAG